MKLIHRIAGDLTRLMTERDQLAMGKIPANHITAPEVACLITDMEREWMEMLKSTQDAEDILEEKEQELAETKKQLLVFKNEMEGRLCESAMTLHEKEKELEETKAMLANGGAEDWDVAEMEGIIDDLNSILEPKGCEGTHDIVDTVQLLIKVAPTCNYCPTILISDRHPDVKITSGSCGKCMKKAFTMNEAYEAKMKKAKEETK